MGVNLECTGGAALGTVYSSVHNVISAVCTVLVHFPLCTVQCELVLG